MSVKYARENEKLVILGGAMGKTVLDANAVKALADLPSLDELQGQADRPPQAPATKIARTLKEPGAQLARVAPGQERTRSERPPEAEQPIEPHAATSRLEPIQRSNEGS